MPKLLVTYGTSFMICDYVPIHLVLPAFNLNCIGHGNVYYTNYPN